MKFFNSLDKCSIDQLNEVFNSSFSDYLIPLQLTCQQMEMKFHSENYCPTISVGVSQDSRIGAFIFHAIDMFDGKKIAYNGGTGVIPTWRGEKLTQKMYQYVLPKLKDEGVEKIVLEVLENNTPAIQSYLNVGFRKNRFVRCYKGELSENDFKSSWELNEIENMNWENVHLFWDIKPTWQNNILTIQRLSDKVKIWGAYSDNKLIGYCVFIPQNSKIVQLAVHPDYRRKKVATSLLSLLPKGVLLYITNVEAKENIQKFLEVFNFDNYCNQWELVCDIY